MGQKEVQISEKYSEQAASAKIEAIKKVDSNSQKIAKKFLDDWMKAFSQAGNSAKDFGDTTESVLGKLAGQILPNVFGKGSTGGILLDILDPVLKNVFGGFFAEGGNYIGCFEPLYEVYENLPKYPLPEVEAGYFAHAMYRILENFEQVEIPESLDVIVFRFLGGILHFGIFLEAGTQGHPDIYTSRVSATSQGKFLHVQRGSAFEIQRLSIYENKVLGYFKAKPHLKRKC